MRQVAPAFFQKHTDCTLFDLNLSKKKGEAPRRARACVLMNGMPDASAGRSLAGRRHVSKRLSFQMSLYCIIQASSMAAGPRSSQSWRNQPARSPVVPPNMLAAVCR